MAIASGQITIMDYNDAIQLTSYIKSNQATTQLYNPNTGSYTPDWKTDNLKLTTSLYVTGFETDMISFANSVEWYEVIDGKQVLVSEESQKRHFDTESTRVNKTLILLTNELENTSHKEFIAKTTYVDTVYGVPLVSQASITLTRLSSGNNACWIILSTPNGNVFRNKKTTSLSIHADFYSGGDLINVGTSPAIQWFVMDEESADTGAGKGWKLITGTDTNYHGENTANLFVDNAAVLVSASYKAKVVYNGKTYFAYSTLIDNSDPVQISIDSSNGSVLQNPTDTTNLIAMMYQSGIIIDEYGNDYTYKWTKRDKDGNLTDFAASTKTISIVNKDQITEKATFVVNVSKGTEKVGAAQFTIMNQEAASGTSSHLHIKYSAVPHPTTADQISDTPNVYIGTCVNDLPDAPTDPAQYTWAQFKGDKGDTGATGASMIVQYSKSKDKPADSDTSWGTDSDGAIWIRQKIGDANWSTPIKIAGDGLKTVVYTYGLSNDKTVDTNGVPIDTAITWTPDRSSLLRDKDHKYIWSHEIVTFISGATSSVYTCDISWDDLNSQEEILNRLSADKTKPVFNEVKDTSGNTFHYLNADFLQASSIKAQIIDVADLVASGLSVQTAWINTAMISNIDGDKITANTITANQIASEAITANEIKTGSITSDKLVSKSISAGCLSDELRSQLQELSDTETDYKSLKSDYNNYKEKVIGQYLDFTDTTGLIIGKNGSTLKTQITNDAFNFLDGSGVVAYINNQLFNINDGKIYSSLTFGEEYTITSDTTNHTLSIKYKECDA